MTGHFFNTMSEDSVNDTDYSLIYKYEPKAQKEWHKRIAEGREQKGCQKDIRRTNRLAGQKILGQLDFFVAA